MERKRYKPKFDKLFFFILIPTAILLLGLLILAVLAPSTFGNIIIVGTVLFTAYFFISPCFGYAELREQTLFIKFGFLMKKEIPYAHIRGIEKKRTAIADSMLSLKNAMEHINVKCNAFDVFSLSLKEEEDFINELKARSNINQK